MFISTSVFAYNDDPAELFSTASNVTTESKIKWVSVNDVTAQCNRERSAKGQAGFNAKLKACSFWDDNHTSCTIITGKNVNMHTIGHEMRHCFQGDWHQ